MNLSPELKQKIEEIASIQGISADEFIIRTLLEKTSSFSQSIASESASQTGLREKEGLLVFETEPLDNIDFNALIAQSREECDWESANS